MRSKCTRNKIKEHEKKLQKFVAKRKKQLKVIAKRYQLTARKTPRMDVYQKDLLKELLEFFERRRHC